MRSILYFLLRTVRIHPAKTLGEAKTDSSSPVPDEAYDLFPHVDWPY
jgi:hypothetical protein